jgi:chromosome segregation ATPase
MTHFLRSVKKERLSMEKMILKIFKKLEEVQKNVEELKQDTSELKQDVSELKQDVSELKQDTSELKQGQKELKHRVSNIEITLEHKIANKIDSLYELSDLTNKKADQILAETRAYSERCDERHFDYVLHVNRYHTKSEA